MTSLYNSIYQIMVNNNEISNAELIEMFPKEKIKTIRDYASKARREFKDKDQELDRISIETIEPIILKLINKNPNTHNIKLAMDLIKAKIADRGMEDDLDIDRFIKKTLTTLRSQDNVDKNEKEPNIPNGYITRGEAIYNAVTHNDSVKETEDEEYLNTPITGSTNEFNKELYIKGFDSLLNDPEDNE